MKTILAVIILSILPAPLFGQDESFISMLKQARQGSVDAQNEVGAMYSEGQGVKPNQKTAVYWFRKSAEQGYSLGACNLGLHYGRGWGVPRNRISLMKWVFIAHSLDGLKCQPADYIEFFKPSECQIERGWERAVAWLRTHPDFKNSFGERPWLEPDESYPITVREHGPTIRLPIKRKKRCG